jgi:hypothetical protein
MRSGARQGLPPGLFDSSDLLPALMFLLLLLLLLLCLLLCLLLLLLLLLLRVPLTAASKLLISRALLLLPLPLPLVCPRSSIVCPHRFLFVLQEPKVVLLTIEADFTGQRSRTARPCGQKWGPCLLRSLPGSAVHVRRQGRNQRPSPVHRPGGCCIRRTSGAAVWTSLGFRQAQASPVPSPPNMPVGSGTQRPTGAPRAPRGPRGALPSAGSADNRSDSICFPVMT